MQGGCNVFYFQQREELFESFLSLKMPVPHLHGSKNL